MGFVELEWEGAREVARALRDVARAIPSLIDRILYRWGQESRAGLKSTPYPPRRATRYVRTGQLANRWKAELLAPGVLAIVNRAQARGRRYASYVIGDEQGRQAYMHTGIWWTGRGQIEQVHWPRIDEIADEETERVLRRAGLE